MSLSRRGLAASVTVVAFAGAAAAEPGDEASVATAVEAFRKAMQANDRAQLDALCAAQLSYGHSDGKVQSKDVFVADASSGKATWKTLEFSAVKNSVAGDAAVSRFGLTGDLEMEEKTVAVKINVLMVWQKQDGGWKLLARQGFKV